MLDSRTGQEPIQILIPSTLHIPRVVLLEENLLQYRLDLVTVIEEYLAIPKRKFLCQMIPSLNGCFRPGEEIADAAGLNSTCEITSEQNMHPMSFCHSMLIWNCRGSGSSQFLEDMNLILKEYRPSLAVIVDTNTTKEESESLITKLGFLIMW